ncbi:MAG: Flavodoxin reductases (ferredoxin-NADPH reductases) family 1 [uncultured Nocardioidaceae bacterium]|uniref:Flavodoxin reductases (Ferredoxin-NADPH reductases) family 1 n=1 Tax=uncultured Nocardioidaceae bacterium TaxID=253824 RepID=A0A6J4M8G3_9ACTN|nr:MAG: Flavodoxin reductases (ferredoxin-NADPH reductases) family 1 [uncultured Nocardioidaceae bacterium]
MSRNYHRLAFTATVLEASEGSDAARDPLSDDERDFIAGMDGFYLATVSRTGWPYVQFRGGPSGFVTTPDEHTIAWPDFSGNRQYISTGNLTQDDRAALIFLDYAHPARLKVYGHASIADIRSSSPEAVSDAVTFSRARAEREIRIEVSAYDWNCPQHITPRYTAEQLAPVWGRLRQRVSELEAENARLRRQSATGADEDEHDV